MNNCRPRKTVVVETARVFTKNGRHGNQLGVVTDAAGLSDAQMQKIAKKLGFSETSFVFPPGIAKADYIVRFFTPAQEIPFAGHPTLGTLFVLEKSGLVAKKGAYVQQIGKRKIPLKKLADGRITMAQGAPSFGKKIGRETSAKLLSLRESDVAGDGEVVSTGLPHLIIPLSSKTALKKARISAKIHDQVRKTHHMDAVMPFFADDATVLCRNFCPALGVVEDPATGSGCGPLACLINRRWPLSDTDGTMELEILQGSEELSQLFTWVSTKGGEIANVDVGGYCSPGKQIQLKI